MEILKKINWLDVVVAVVLTYVLFMVIGRRG